jgi:hypothetical protein
MDALLPVPKIRIACLNCYHYTSKVCKVKEKWVSQHCVFMV